MSAVVKVRLMELLVLLLLEGIAASESVVSGPESINGAETFIMSVYGGPYEPFCKLTFAATCVVRAQLMSGASLKSFVEGDDRRSRFCPGALGALARKV